MSDIWVLIPYHFVDDVWKRFCEIVVILGRVAGVGLVCIVNLCLCRRCSIVFSDDVRMYVLAIVLIVNS